MWIFSFPNTICWKTIISSLNCHLETLEKSPLTIMQGFAYKLSEVQVTPKPSFWCPCGAQRQHCYFSNKLLIWFSVLRVTFFPQNLLYDFSVSAVSLPVASTGWNWLYPSLTQNTWLRACLRQQNTFFKSVWEFFLSPELQKLTDKIQRKGEVLLGDID